MWSKTTIKQNQDEILKERTEEINHFIQSLEAVEDERVDRGKLHSLSEIFFLVLCAQICCYESFREYVIYGNLKIDLLRKYFPYQYGIPSRTTISRVLALFKPNFLEDLLIKWMSQIIELSNEQQTIAIDGKRHRGVKGEENQLHLVGAYATQKGLLLGEEKVACKSNEITAIPILLDKIIITNQIVSIDAMGCQKVIATKIREKNADYVLALKGNQSNLHEEIKLFFSDAENIATCAVYEQNNKGHGRVETRKCYASNQINWLHDKKKWDGLKTIVMIESTRWTPHKEEKETRFFITSLDPNPKKILNSVRAHWGIENGLHWVLDVIFKEDDRIIWNQNVAQNESVLRRVGLNLLKQYQEFLNPEGKDHKKTAIKTLRKILMIDDLGMIKLLSGKF